MKKALLIALMVIVVSFVLAIKQSKSTSVYIANAQQAVGHFLEIYPSRVGAIEGREVFRWPVILRPGDVLEEAFLASEPPIRIERPSWLFFVDLQPGTLFQHPTQFVLVQQNGGRMEVHARNTYPKLNDVRLFSTHEERENKVLRLSELDYLDPIELDAFMDHIEPPVTNGYAGALIDNEGFHGSRVPDVSEVDFDRFSRYTNESKADFQRRVLGYLEKAQANHERQQHLEGCGSAVCKDAGAKLALIIEGGNVNPTPSRLAAQYLKHAGYLTYRLSSAASQADASTRTYPTDLDTIQRAFEWLQIQTKGCCDEILVLIHAQSSPAGELEMNSRRHHYIYDSVTGKPTGEILEMGRKRGGYLNTRELRSYLNRLNSCKVNVFIQSSFAGAHLEQGLNVLPESNDPGCACRVVAVTATARQTARESGYFAFVRGLSSQSGFTGAFEALWNWTQGPLKTELARVERQQLPQVSATTDLYCTDADRDGLCYGEEMQNGYSNPDAADTDGDGLNDFDERALGTDPRMADTDSDGVNDNNEHFGGTSPNNADSDGDTLTDGEEYERGLDPTQADSDGDGYNDGFELEQNSDPLNKESYPGKATDAMPVIEGDNTGE